MMIWKLCVNSSASVSVSRTPLRFVCMLGAFSSLASCFKGVEAPSKLIDLTQATYQVAGLDSIYYPIVNDTLRIQPRVMNSAGEVVDTNEYETIWIQRTSMSAINSAGRPIDTLYGESLAYKASLSYSGAYIWECKITNKKTGFYYSKSFVVNTVAPSSDCFYFLCQVGVDQSRLDALFYNNGAGDYELKPDILGYMYKEVLAGPRLYHLKGAPNFVCDGFASALGAAMGYYIAVSSTGGAVMLNAVTLAPKSSFGGGDSTVFDFSSLLLNVVGKQYDPRKVLFMQGAGADPILINYDHQLFVSKYDLRFRDEGYIIPGTDDTKLKASQWLLYPNTTFNTEAVAFDEDRQSFYYLSTTGASYQDVYTISPFTLPYREKKKLIYAKYVDYQGGRCFAVLQNNHNDSCYVLSFDLKGNQYAYKAIDAAGLDAAVTKFTVSKEHGYLFYTVGSKVYAFDLNTGSSILMADYGNKEISMLETVKPFALSNTAASAMFNQMTRCVVIASYDKGSLESSGVVDFYTVAASGQQISLLRSFTGLGKVVSMTYFRL